MEWISAKEAARLVGRSQTVISRFTKKYENTKHVKRKGRSVLLDKEFVLLKYLPESTGSTIAESQPKVSESKELIELRATVSFMIELQAKTENAHEDLMLEKDARIKDLRIELEAKTKQLEQQLELFRIDRHEMNSLILEQSRIISRQLESSHNEKLKK